MKKSKTKDAPNRCFKCSREVILENGKAIDAASGVPKPFMQREPGDGFICNECDSVMATENIRRDFLKQKSVRI